MPTHPQNPSMHHPTPATHTAELIASLTALNARIARLAAFVQANLADERLLDDILERRVAVLHAPVPGLAPAAASARRTHQDWEELRGLLALRCEVMTRYIDEFGIAATRDLAALSESALEAQGFAPGADGLRLIRRYPATPVPA